MTTRASYASLIDGIFGTGTAEFDTNNTASNNVIDALARIGQFAEFKKCFTERLNRLRSAVALNGDLQKPILNAVNQVADGSNWDGAYAELCALDYLLADPATDASKIELDVTVSAVDTLASEMGMQNANHDVRVASFGVSMDTKLLSDKIGDILEGVFEEARKKKSIKKLSIFASYPVDQPFSLYQNNRKALLNELEVIIDVTRRTKEATSNVIPDLSYQFAWDANVYVSASSYDIDKHAQNHHRLLFGHAKKFSRKEPTVLVFVHFPWSGERLWPMNDGAKRFFKSFGTEFFDAYLGSTTEARTINRQFKSAITVEQVTRHLSAVLFLEDQSVLATTANLVNVEASYLLNSNAQLSLRGSQFEQYLQRRNAVDLSTLR